MSAHTEVSGIRRDRPASSRGARGPHMGRSIVTTYAARFASIVAYVALLPIVLHTFGADAYGVYVLTVSVGALFQQDLGIGDATTRFIAVAAGARDSERMRRIASASWAFYLVVAVVMSLATAIAFVFTLTHTKDVPASLEQTAWVLAGLGVANVFCMLIFSTNRQVLGGLGRLEEVNYLLIAQAALRIALTVLVCVLDLGIIAVGAVDLLATLAFGLVAFLLRHHRAREVRPSLRSFEWSVFRELFGVSAQLMVLGIASVAIMQVGGILTAMLLPIAYTAIYAAAQRVFLLVKEVSNSLSIAALPTASIQHGAADHRANARLYLQGTSLANMLMTLVLVPVLAFLPQIMQWWIGPSGLQAALVAQILIVSMFANNNHVLGIPILTAQGSVRGYAILHSVWAVAGCALAFVLGEQLGLAGIALGLTVPVVILEPIYVWIALRRLDLTVGAFVRRCLVAPFATVLVPAAALVALGRFIVATPALVVALTAAWLVVAMLLYWFFGLDDTGRGAVAVVVSGVRRRLLAVRGLRAVREGMPDVDHRG